MNENKQPYYISHIARDELPTRGLAKLYFYTKKGDSYYWGTDNNSFSETQMKNLEDKKQVIKLPELLEIKPEERKTLWTDSDGSVYIADDTKPYSGKIIPLENIVLKI
jgi:hypothetical protein